MMLGTLLAAWAALIYVNAIHGHHVDPAGALQYFWPPAGHFALAQWLAAQRLFWEAAGTVAPVIIGSLSVGTVVRGWIGPRTRPGVVAAGERLVLGQALGGTAVFGLALTGLVYPPLLVAGFVVMLAAGTSGAVDAVRVVRSAAMRLELSAPAALIALVTVLGVLAATLAPETTNDALRFHLEIPRRLLLVHRLVPQEEHIYSWLPVIPACLHVLPFWVCGATAVRLLAALAYVLVALVVADLVQATGGTRGDATRAAAAWCVLLGVPILAPLAMTDILLALSVTLALRAQWRGQAVLAGCLWGAALGMKYQAGIFMGGALAAQAWERRRGTGRLLGASLLVVLPLLVRAWVQTGSPVAPFLVPWWGTGAAEQRLPLADVRALGAGSLTLAGWLTAPYRLATRVGVWDSLCSPLVVAILPLVLLVPVKATSRVAILVALAIWSLVAGYSGRYLLPLVPCLLVAATGAARRRFGAVFRSGGARLAFTLMLLFEAAASLHWAYRSVNPMTVWLGRETPATYLRRNLVPRPLLYDATLALAPVLRPATRYTVEGLDNGFYLGGLPFIEIEDVPSPWLRWSTESDSAARLRVTVRQRGLVGCFVRGPSGLPGGPSAAGPGGWTPRTIRLYREFASRYLVVRHRWHQDGDDAVVYLDILKVPARNGAAGS